MWNLFFLLQGRWSEGSAAICICTGKGPEELCRKGRWWLCTELTECLSVMLIQTWWWLHWTDSECLYVMVTLTNMMVTVHWTDSECLLWCWQAWTETLMDFIPVCSTSRVKLVNGICAILMCMSYADQEHKLIKDIFKGVITMKFYWKRTDELCTYVFVCVHARTQPVFCWSQSVSKPQTGWMTIAGPDLSSQIII